MIIELIGVAYYFSLLTLYKYMCVGDDMKKVCPLDVCGT